MTNDSPAQRRRGGQPGNQNAKGNRGNPNPKRNYGNRGGGAPRFNQNAHRRPPTALAILLREYQHDPEAIAWIKAHERELQDAAFTEDDRRDRALYDGYCGSTLEALVASGQEFRRGAYVRADDVFGEDFETAA